MSEIVCISYCLVLARRKVRDSGKMNLDGRSLDSRKVVRGDLSQRRKGSQRLAMLGLENVEVKGPWGKNQGDLGMRG
jgi:hypothetical protein